MQCCITPSDATYKFTIMDMIYQILLLGPNHITDVT